MDSKNFLFTSNVSVPEFFLESDSEEDFVGFTAQDIFVAESRVKAWHSKDAESFAVEQKENLGDTAHARGKKRARESERRGEDWEDSSSPWPAVHTSSGKVKPARTTGPPCGCKHECFEAVDEEVRGRVLAAVNDMASTDAQNFYLKGLIDAKDPYRVGSQGRGGKFRGNALRRTKTFTYHIRDDGNRRIKICQKKPSSVSTASARDESKRRRKSIERNPRQERSTQKPPEYDQGC